MSANNTFNINRFLMLFRQHYIHNNKIMLYSLVGYCGLVFLFLSFVQIQENMTPFDLEYFMGFLTSFTAIIGILFVGHSFPAFRSKESTITYLTLPASLLEKFLFEFIYRVGSILIVLPLLYWIVFHLQGYFFQLFIEEQFVAIGFTDLLEEAPVNADFFWAFSMIILLSLLALELAFTGAAHFSRQPLVKTLFSVAVVVIFFIGFIYVVFEEFGLNNYSVNENLRLMPFNEKGAFQFFTTALLLANAVIMGVAYLKLKEKEV